MAKTVSGLIAHAKEYMAKAVYMYGNNGQVITEALIQAKARKYPRVYSQTYIDKLRKDIGKIGIDCSGIIDIYLGIDKSADGYYSSATIKGTDMTKMPKIPGIFVHHTGHIGIYIGDNKVIEANGIDLDIIIRDISEGNWVRWSKSPLLDFDLPEEGVTKVTEISKKTNPYVRPAMTSFFKLKSRGEGVKWFQFILKNLGLYNDDIDGIFGKNTHNAVLAFQAKCGLKRDGIVGPRTMAKFTAYNK